MRNLIATKSLSYATRRLQAGQGFTANNRDARILVAIGKARVVADVSAPPAVVQQKIQKPPATSVAVDGKAALDKLRGDYFEVVKKKPYHGWDAAELQRRIDEALAS
jgi:hypothetical protein